MPEKMSQNVCHNMANVNTRGLSTASKENTRNSDVVVNVSKEKKKLRRAFSMPRNPFRLSRRFNKNTKESDASAIQTTKLSEIGDCAKVTPNRSTQTMSSALSAAAPPPPPPPSSQLSSASTPPNQATATSVAPTTAMATTTITPTMNGTGAAHKHRIFRRPSFKKFLSRIAQQVTSINIGVSSLRISVFSQFIHSNNNKKFA